MKDISESAIISIIEDAGTLADMDKIKSGQTLTEAGFDSLDLAGVLLTLEEKYEIKIPDEDTVQLATVKGIVQYLESKVSQ